MQLLLHGSSVATASLYDSYQGTMQFRGWVGGGPFTQCSARAEVGLSITTVVVVVVVENTVQAPARCTHVHSFIHSLILGSLGQP